MPELANGCSRERLLVHDDLVTLFTLVARFLDQGSFMCQLASLIAHACVQDAGQCIT